MDLFTWKQRCAYHLWELWGKVIDDGRRQWYEAEKIIYRNPLHVHENPRTVAYRYFDEVAGHLPSRWP